MQTEKQLSELIADLHARRCLGLILTLEIPGPLCTSRNNLQALNYKLPLNITGSEENKSLMTK